MQEVIKMIYISKGWLTSEENGLCSVIRFDTEYNLTKSESEIWLAGQGCLKETDSILTVDDLEEFGLVGISEDDSETGIFELLCACFFIPCRTKNIQPMTVEESYIYKWLSDAGIRLTTAELICLCEKDLLPEKDLLGEDGRQNLVAAIYLDSDINDITLENQAAKAECRSWVLASLLSLVQKKYVYIS